jgi:large subunit ribosomal protein L25
VLVVGVAPTAPLVTQELNAIQVEADVSSIPEQIEVSVEGSRSAP